MFFAAVKDAQAKNVGLFAGIFHQHSSVLKALKFFFNLFICMSHLRMTMPFQHPKKAFQCSGQINKPLRSNFACSDVLKACFSVVLPGVVPWHSSENGSLPIFFLT